MNGSHLLNGKFSPAKFPEVCVPRNRLTRLFRQEENKRVIFVSAPAGYGKTVSTRLWLSDTGREVIWIVLDGYDNTPSIFYKLICKGILSVQPGNKAMEDILKSLSFDNSPVEHAIRLMTEFVPDGKRYAIVLDDMHLVSNGEIRESAILVQKRLPLSFITVLITRDDKWPVYVPITGEDHCAAITAKDLVFSVDEVRDFFDACGQPLSLEEAQDVHKATEGWAMGVSAMGMSDRAEPEKGVQRVTRYIKSQIWEKCDADLQRFMLRTGIVDEMTAGLCERLTGCKDGAQALDRLISANSFVGRTSDDGCCYHPLFLNFLRGMIDTCTPSVKSLYRTASLYFIDQKDYLSAGRYAIKSEDLELIKTVVYGYYRHYADMPLSEHVKCVEAWKKEEMIEAVYNRDPFLHIPYLWSCYLSGYAKGMIYSMDKLYQCMPVLAEHYPQFLEKAVLETFLDHRVPFSEQTAYFARLASVGDGESARTVSLSLQMPFLHRSSRDFSALCDRRLMERMGETIGAWLGERGEIMLRGIRSGLYLERNKPKEAMDEALRANARTDAYTSCELKCSILLHMAAACHMMKDDGRFYELLNDADQYIESRGRAEHSLMRNLLAYKSKILLYDGSKAAARDWLEQPFVLTPKYLELYKIYQHFTTARAYMVLAQTEKAMGHIEKLRRLAVDFGRPLDAAEAAVLQAVLEWATGKKEEAQLTLEEALLDMQTYGFVRVFADEGASVLPILRKLASRQKDDRHDQKALLDAHYLNAVTVAAYEQSRRYKGIAANIRTGKRVKLSHRQALIISLLSQGYRNVEIAESTGLSIHTVKSHCAAAYAKLDVNNAMDAVLKARELGMIE